MSSDQSLAVVKVGGSLFSQPRLGAGLRAWLDRQPEPRVLLVPGGGALADGIREFYRVHALSEETCHWLALQCLSVTARFLVELLPHAQIVPDVVEPLPMRVNVLDAYCFARADESRPGCLERSWSVTSDSIAARVAELTRATRLVLLKSVRMEPFEGWEDAVSKGWVDEAFPQVIRRCPANLEVEVIHFRDWLDRA